MAIKKQQNIYEESLNTFLKPVAQYIDDPKVAEIMINGYNDVYIESGGKLTKIKSNFTERGLMTLAVNIAQFVGRQLNDENPRLDARLPDGSRIHVVLPPIAKNGVIISIRKFFKEKLTVQRLIDFGSFTPEGARFIQVCVELAKNMIISGGTGSGKTTMLNVLSNFIPSHQRIITMEDALELQLGHEHVVRFETRPPDKLGKGQVTMADLLHSSLRLRPDRVILGEVRGSECFDLLQAMNTGHGGSMSTTHANTPIETCGRLESLILMGGIELPLRAIRAQISSAINIIVSCARLADGSRRTTHISEMMPLDSKGDYQMQDIFVFNQTHKDEKGKIFGYFTPTGCLPTFYNTIVSSGFPDIREEFFNPETYGLEPPKFFMGESHFKTKHDGKVKEVTPTLKKDDDPAKKVVKETEKPAKTAPEEKKVEKVVNNITESASKAAQFAEKLVKKAVHSLSEKEEKKVEPKPVVDDLDFDDDFNVSEKPTKPVVPTPKPSTPNELPSSRRRRRHPESTLDGKPAPKPTPKPVTKPVAKPVSDDGWDDFDDF